MKLLTTETDRLLLRQFYAGHRTRSYAQARQAVRAFLAMMAPARQLAIPPPVLPPPTPITPPEPPVPPMEIDGIDLV